MGKGKYVKKEPIFLQTHPTIPGIICWKEVIKDVMRKVSSVFRNFDFTMLSHRCFWVMSLRQEPPKQNWLFHHTLNVSKGLFFLVPFSFPVAVRPVLLKQEPLGNDQQQYGTRPFTLLKFYFSKCLKIQDKVKRRHTRRLVDLYAEQAQPKKTHTGLAFQNKLIQNMEKKMLHKEHY